MSLGELARAANLGTAALSRIECGRETAPDSVLEDIGRKVGWSLDEVKCGLPSKEEAEKEYARFSDGVTAMIAAMDDAKKRGLKKGNGGQGEIACPICKRRLSYSIASVNGHCWGRCQTSGCVSWMQ